MADEYISFPEDIFTLDEVMRFFSDTQDDTYQSEVEEEDADGELSDLNDYRDSIREDFRASVYLQLKSTKSEPPRPYVEEKMSAEHVYRTAHYVAARGLEESLHSPDVAEYEFVVQILYLVDVMINMGVDVDNVEPLTDLINEFG